jgi:tRNA-2-methylthio-N6-dimethylallyladenosine synthase
MDYVKYDFGYMFYYSERPNTYAAKKMEDNIPLEIKKRRLNEIIAKQQVHGLERNQAKVGNTYEVLVEGVSKKSKEELFGRTTHNTVVVFPKENFKPGDLVNVKVNSCTGATLKGEAVA